VKRYAFVDVDGTIVDGNLGRMLATYFMKHGLPLQRAKRKLRLLPYFLKMLPVALLYPFSSLVPVYDFAQRLSTSQYLDILNALDPKEANAIARRIVSRARVPEGALEFLRALHESGYEIVLLSASPSFLLAHLARRLPVPVRWVGLDDRHPFPLSRLGKALVILTEFRDGVPAVVVGNPRREPFDLAEEVAIVVRSPYELGRWIAAFDTRNGKRNGKRQK